MAKGSAIVLPFGSTEDAAVAAVEAKYAAKIRSPQGWYGNATVRIEGREPSDGKPGDFGRCLIVKAVANGWEVYGLIGTVTNSIKVTRSKFEKV